MREFPKTRKTVKWGGAALAVLVAVLWAVSIKYCIFYRTNPSILGLRTHAIGGAMGGRPDPNGPIGWSVEDASNVQVRVLWPFVYSGGGAWVVWVPLWMPLVICAAASMRAWRLDVLAARRRLQGACPKCRYDRAGLSAGSPCPECGAKLVVAKAEPTIEQPTSPES